MITCKEVSTLHGTGGIQEARLLTRLQVRFHLLMCKHCRRYMHQLRMIARQARTLMTEPDDDERAAADRIGRRVLGRTNDQVE